MFAITAIKIICCKATAKTCPSTAATVGDVFTNKGRENPFQSALFGIKEKVLANPIILLNDPIGETSIVMPEVHGP